MEAFQKGNERFLQKDYEQAITHYTEAIKHAPDNPTILTNRAAAYMAIGENENAINDCKEAIRLQLSILV